MKINQQNSKAHFWIGKRMDPLVMFVLPAVEIHVKSFTIFSDT